MSIPAVYAQLKYLAPPDADDIRRVGFMMSNVKGALLEDDKHFLVDEITCLRYLRMKGGNKEKALKRLEETIAWRSKVKPHRVTADDVAPLLSKGDMILSDAKTHNGAGLVFANSRIVQPELLELQKLFQMWYCEEMMRRGHREVCCVVDFNGMTRAPNGDETKAQDELDDLDKRHYPLFFSKTLLLHVPTFIRAILVVWTAFWPEHQKATLETKVRRDELGKWIDMSHIPVGFDELPAAAPAA